tara:strand:- start:1221 stop:2063 length:843 start_codon:yes stop_codon:yes gene_type:complete
MNEIISEKELSEKYNVFENSGNGDCLFLAIEQLDDRYGHKELRNKVCNSWKKMKLENKEYYDILSLSDDFIDDDGRQHDISICHDYVWGSLTDVALLAEILQRPIIVYSRITNRKINGAYNPNYNKYLQLDIRKPGTIFKKNKISCDASYEGPLFLKLKITSSYGHFEGMKLKRSSSNVSMTLNTKSSTRKKSKKSKTKRKSPESKKSPGSKKSPTSKKLKTMSNTKKSKKTQSRRKKSPITIKSNNTNLKKQEEDDIEEAIFRSMLDFTKPNTSLKTLK